MKTATIVLLATSLVSVDATANEEILKVKKSTFVNLVDLLVQRGVINQQEGNDLVNTAKQEAIENAIQPPAADSASVKNPETTIANPKPDAVANPSNPENIDKTATKIKHVGYVPEFIKKEIRDQVRAELKSEVVSDVKQDAKTEGWGVPGALPEWVAAIHPSFDARLRFQNNFFASDNQTGYGIGPYNYLQINQDGGIAKALARNPLTEAFLNVTKNQLLLRERFRLGFEANITDGLKAGVRFATSNTFNPVSNDQALGNTGQAYQFAIDRSYLQYDYIDGNKTNWFSLYGGRIINPFLSTDLVFDPDLSFEGFAGSLRYHFNQADPVVRGYKAGSPTGRVGINHGQQTPDSLFMTLGVFPIQNVNFSSSSKWLYAGQIGADWLVFENSRFNIASAYYEFQNISARYNPANGTGHEYDWTAPQFLQHGNSMVAITDINSGNGTVCSDPAGCLFGLASGFKIFNVTAIYDYLFQGKTHILFTADYAKNLGFNQQLILAEFHQNVVPRTTAYQFRMDVGVPQIRRLGDWNINFAYKYLQRDAVLDAFTDSQFHLGGTDARGWALGAQYGIAKNTWLDTRWYSSDAIDGPKYSVDNVYVDLNARF